jgi:hypothetical protein
VTSQVTRGKRTDRTMEGAKKILAQKTGKAKMTLK